MQNILCFTTLPRSGNVHLVRLLHTYLDRPVHTCRKTDNGACCNKVPCIEVDEGVFVLRRMHDPYLTLPKPNLPTIIQHRDPIGHILSYSEYGRAKEMLLGASAVVVEFWVARRAVYMIGFLDKWVRSPTENTMVIAYSDIFRDPRPVFETVAAFVGFPFDEARFAAARRAVAAIPLRFDNGKPVYYRPRDTSRSDVLPWPLVAEFDRVVRKEAPYMDWEASGGPTGAHPTLERTVREIRAMDASLALEDDAVISAADAISNPAVLRDAGKRLEKLGRHTLSNALFKRAAAKRDAP